MATTKQVLHIPSSWLKCGGIPKISFLGATEVGEKQWIEIEEERVSVYNGNIH